MAFCDFVSFIRKDSELVKDPTYSPGALSKAIDKRAPKNSTLKAPRESLKPKVTSFTSESNNPNVNVDSGENLLSVHCNKDHDIDSCSEFLATSPYYRNYTPTASYRKICKILISNAEILVSFATL